MPSTDKPSLYYYMPSTDLKDNQKQILFCIINDELKRRTTLEQMTRMRTKSGQTQKSEKPSIKLVKDVLDSMGLSYKQAGSQQSKDFRNIGGIGLNIEVKKTDSGNVMFNDTCPSEDIYYIIFFTGKKLKRSPSIPPRIICINGEDIVDRLSVKQNIQEFNQDLKNLKDKWGRGKNARKLLRFLRCYPRANFAGNVLNL